MKKMKIVLLITQVANCGVGYYRQWLPLKQLEKRGMIDLSVYSFNWGEKEVKPPWKCTYSKRRIESFTPKPEFLKDVKNCDLIYICRDEMPEFISVVGGLRDTLKKPAVVDIDDYVQHTRPFNPGYISFHPGSSYNKFNKTLLKMVDGITTSTKYLKKAYKGINKDIHVCPNSLDFEWRDKYLNIEPKIKRQKDEIRIGWAGSAGHLENLRLIESAVKKILTEYPNTTFHYTGLFGDLFDWKDLKDRVKTVKFANLKDWARKLKSMDLDIALAPLCDNHFNRGKSNLRVLEYGAAQFPVIASPVLPYKGFRKEIMFAQEEHEWYNKIKELVENTDKRNELKNKLYKKVKNDYNIEKNCLIWYKALKKFV